MCDLFIDFSIHLSYMEKRNNRQDIEKFIQKIAVESGQLMESIQWEHEPLNETQCLNALKNIEENCQNLKKILGKK